MEVRPPTGDGRRFLRHAFVCTSPSACGPDGGEAVQAELKELLRASGRKEELRVNKAGCLGQCGHGPMMVVYPEGTWYCHLSREDARRVWAEHVVGGRPVDELRYVTRKPGTNVVPRLPAAPGEQGPIDTKSPFWSACTRCPHST
ncbi:MAG: hypothetical protein QOD77_1109 [Thermoplasmata archaeon]|nr:hypothetical protein [Thermoplasmata archaeon]